MSRSNLCFDVEQFVDYQAYLSRTQRVVPNGALPVNQPPSILTCFDELMDYSTKVGTFGNRKLSINGIRFYQSVVKLALEKSPGTGGTSSLYETDDFCYSEPSVKGAISFLVGMTMAQLVPVRLFNIVSPLFHLKDPRLILLDNQGRDIQVKDLKNTPDYFCYDDSDSGYFIEAKGSGAQNYTPTNQIKDACVQLAKLSKPKNYSKRKPNKRNTKTKTAISGIAGITIKTKNKVNKTYLISSRHVISTHFAPDHSLICTDVDPEPAADGSIIEIKEPSYATYLCYENVLSILIEHLDEITTVRPSPNAEYLVVQDHGNIIGMDKGLLDGISIPDLQKLRDADSENGHISFVRYLDSIDGEGFHEKVNRILTEKRETYNQLNESESPGRVSLPVAEVEMSGFFGPDGTYFQMIEAKQLMTRKRNALHFGPAWYE